MTSNRPSALSTTRSFLRLSSKSNTFPTPSAPGKLIGRPRLRLARLGFELEREDIVARLELLIRSPSPSTGLALSDPVEVCPRLEGPLDFFLRRWKSFFIPELVCSPSTLLRQSMSTPSWLLICCKLFTRDSSC